MNGKNTIGEGLQMNNPLSNPTDFLSIPVDLLIYSLKYKKVNQVKLYISLKSLFNGQFKQDDKTIHLVCKTLSYKCTKTFHRNFNWLITHKWVTFKHNYCIIKSFTKLKFNNQAFSQRSVLFIPSFDLKFFRPFIYGAVITYQMKLKRMRDRYSGIAIGYPYKKYHPHSASYDLPVTYLMAILNISKGAASGYKSIAAKSGYLSVRKDYKELNISGANLSSYKRFSEDTQLHKLRVIKGELYLQQPDRISSEMIVKRKRNLRKS